MLYDTFTRAKMKNISHTVPNEPKMTWNEIQTIVRSGTAAEYFNIRDQLTVEKLSSITASVGKSSCITSASVDADKFFAAYNEMKSKKYVFTFDGKLWRNSTGNTVVLANYGISVIGTPLIGDKVIVTKTTTPIKFDIIGIDHDIPSDTNYTHSMTLQMHDLWPSNMLFDAAEATWYIDESIYPNGLAAGTYHFTTSDGNVYHFTLANTVPVGGQIRYDYKSTIKTYASIGSDTELESVTVDSGESGTLLSSITINDVTATTNSEYRTKYGSNNWINSSLRQWLNTDKDGGTWWEPKSNFDRPANANSDGFLKGLDPAFLAVVGEVTKKTQLSVSENYELATSTERFFLLSRSEIYAEIEKSTDGTDSAAYPYYGAKYSDLAEPGTGADSNRIKYKNNSAAFYWLRSPNGNHSGSCHNISSSGSLAGNSCSISYGVAPVCVIV